MEAIERVQHNEAVASSPAACSPADMARWCPSWQAEPDAEVAEAPQRTYEHRGEAGAPAPLAPSLVTLSLLPRTQVSAMSNPRCLVVCECSS